MTVLGQSCARQRMIICRQCLHVTSKNDVDLKTFYTSSVNNPSNSVDARLLVFDPKCGQKIVDAVAHYSEVPRVSM